MWERRLPPALKHDLNYTNRKTRYKSNSGQNNDYVKFKPISDDYAKRGRLKDGLSGLRSDGNYAARAEDEPERQSSRPIESMILLLTV